MLRCQKIRQHSSRCFIKLIALVAKKKPRHALVFYTAQYFKGAADLITLLQTGAALCLFSCRLFGINQLNERRYEY